MVIDVGGLKGKILLKGTLGNRCAERRGPESPVPSRNTGRRVSLWGEPKRLTREGIAKATSLQPLGARGAVLIRRKSQGDDQKADELDLGRLKRAERLVEDRKRSDVQFVALTWA